MYCSFFIQQISFSEIDSFITNEGNLIGCTYIDYAGMYTIYIYYCYLYYLCIRFSKWTPSSLQKGSMSFGSCRLPSSFERPGAQAASPAAPVTRCAVCRRLIPGVSMTP